MPAGIKYVDHRSWSYWSEDEITRPNYRGSFFQVFFPSLRLTIFYQFVRISTCNSFFDTGFLPLQPCTCDATSGNSANTRYLETSYSRHVGTGQDYQESARCCKELCRFRSESYVFPLLSSWTSAGAFGDPPIPDRCRCEGIWHAYGSLQVSLLKHLGSSRDPFCVSVF